MPELLNLFLKIALISVTSYSGSAQSLFYDVGVSQLQWVTNQDYISYLGFGFASPGPQVFSLATFMGYGKFGLLGGLVGTIAIYIMPIMLSILSARYLTKRIHNPGVESFIQTVGIAAAGLLAGIGIKILTDNHISPLYLFIAITAVFATVKKVSPIFIIVSGLLIGLLLQ